MKFNKINKITKFKEKTTVVPSKDNREAKLVATYGWGSDVESIVEALGGDLITIHNENELREAGEFVDLVILQGGTDISPHIYGQKDNGKCQSPDRNRDVVELGLMEIAIKHKLPVLGICRGNQMLAAAMGGTLHQDIDNHPYSRHRIFWQTENKPVYWVNSLHHQAVDQVPKDFSVLARAADGTIEAIYSPLYKAMGVQFHPEMLAQHEPQWLSIFQWWYGGYAKLAPIHSVDWYKRWIYQRPQGARASESLYWDDAYGFDEERYYAQFEKSAAAAKPATTVSSYKKPTSGYAHKPIAAMTDEEWEHYKRTELAKITKGTYEKDDADKTWDEYQATMGLE